MDRLMLQSQIKSISIPIILIVALAGAFAEPFGLTRAETNMGSEYWRYATTVTAAELGSGEDENPYRMREGDKFKDTKAKFKSSGLRYVLHPGNGGPPIVVLENLAMERIAGYLTKSGTNSTWLVEGTVTEYQGGNYILISRAHVNALAIDNNPLGR
jgi:hypothetical protein